MKKEYSALWANIISIAAIIISLVFSIRQCHNEKQLNFRISSLEYNPKLSIVDTPIVNNLSFGIPESIFKTPILIIDKKVFINKNYDFKIDSPSTINIFVDNNVNLDSLSKSLKDTIKEITLDKIEYVIHSTIKLKNEGNSLGRILTWTVIDSTSGYDFLREEFIKFIKKESTTYKIDTNEADPFFQTDILSGRTIDIPIDLRILRITDDKKMGLHFLILYENEYGNIYDTYFWIIFENIPVEMLSEYSIDPIDSIPQVRFKIGGLKNFKVYKIKESFNIYDNEETELIKEWLSENFEY